MVMYGTLGDDPGKVAGEDIYRTTLLLCKPLQQKVIEKREKFCFNRLFVKRLKLKVFNL
jgi:hypothetical protein